ncbi:Dam family site-specific DNA-(adenine-N6)-methyltransferase [Paenibacillus peoriae]|uniref:DNA adenine methylase n=1 Tax=Paenibacillus peoriae TaxID=59893 RepID=UPI00026C5A12|nr:Dam family site-specific DNA-(adenine-N6)-methyltransferase [Paenibacillus peoriae]MEC0181347.1 Dam family site-specific DNA-(adenine-N6)-methyltransferase [Paenibacillus peoriae]
MKILTEYIKNIPGAINERKATTKQYGNFKHIDFEVKGAPLLKWPGGKRNLLKHILPLIPVNFKKYYEPFFGGGALFFALQPKNSHLSDCNLDLINCYKQVRDQPHEVIEKLKKLINSESAYYEVRSNIPLGDIDKCVRMIYLTQLSFNGIYRQNLRGEYNVPYGHKTHIEPCDEPKIISASEALSNTKLTCSDFEEAVSGAEEGDLVYFDPPYTISNGKNGFIKYNSRVFSWEDQVRLSNLAIQLANRGCSVVISNANHPSILELYRDFTCKVIERKSIIAASGEYRGQITECIFYNEV